MFFLSSRRRHTILQGDWSSDVCSSDLLRVDALSPLHRGGGRARHRAGALVLPRVPSPWRRTAAGVRRRRSEERRVGNDLTVMGPLDDIERESTEEDSVTCKVTQKDKKV